jgi:protoporphyrinogen oxidase
VRVAIVGAGVAGLAAAFDLTRQGHAVTIYEANPIPGGLASGFKEPGWAWSLERFYHHWFKNDADVLQLIAEMGLSHKVQFPSPVTVVYHEGRFYPLDTFMGQLRFPGLSLLDKLRMAPGILYLRFAPWWQPLERVTADEWLRRWLGRRGYERLMQPLLVSKFGEAYYREVNAAWMWARIVKRTKRLGTFEGGFQAFLDALCEQVTARGAQVRLSTPVQRVASRPDGGLEVEAAGASERFDRVLVTVSPRLLTRLVPELPGGYTEELLRLKSIGAVVLIVALRERLSEQGHYWHNLPKAAGFPFLALVEHTNFIPPEHFGGDHLVYMGDYLPPDHEYFRLTKEELLERFLPALARVNPRFEPGWVRASWLFREPYAQPVPPVNYSRIKPDSHTPVPGLYWISLAHVYPWDRGTNYSVELGRRVAREIGAPETARAAGQTEPRTETPQLQEDRT